MNQIRNLTVERFSDEVDTVHDLPLPPGLKQLQVIKQDHDHNLNVKSSAVANSLSTLQSLHILHMHASCFTNVGELQHAFMQLTALTELNFRWVTLLRISI